MGMTAQELDELKFEPVAGGVSSGRMILILKKVNAESQTEIYITWNHGGKHFIDPILMDNEQKRFVEMHLSTKPVRTNCSCGFEMIH
jgi:hypothetical protein